MKRFKHLLLILAAAIAPTLFTVPAAAQNTPIGIVVMHGKGGSPTARHMTPFVIELERKGFEVNTLKENLLKKKNKHS